MKMRQNRKMVTWLLAISICFSTIQVANHAEARTTKNDGFSFKKIAGKTFTFSSGAGALCTELTITSKGTFKGVYHDVNAGDTGKGYHGTKYICNFSGKFTDLKKINKYTYSMKLRKIKKKSKNKTKIKNKIRYIYTDPYGLEKGKIFYIYLPGIKVKKLPKDFRMWTDLFGSDAPKKLSFYGLYNRKAQYGFRAN